MIRVVGSSYSGAVRSKRYGTRWGGSAAMAPVQHGPITCPLLIISPAAVLTYDRLHMLHCVILAFLEALHEKTEAVSTRRAERADSTNLAWLEVEGRSGWSLSGRQALENGEFLFGAIGILAGKHVPSPASLLFNFKFEKAIPSNLLDAMFSTSLHKWLCRSPSDKRPTSWSPSSCKVPAKEVLPPWMRPD